MQPISIVELKVEVHRFGFSHGAWHFENWVQQLTVLPCLASEVSDASRWQ